ncbi:MAG: hypothetical protein GY940_24855 [bacterium]|nr:hypothetical protein [bacterium]
MKPKTISNTNKLVLNKKTIARLNNHQMNRLQGGYPRGPECTENENGTTCITTCDMTCSSCPTEFE